LICPKLVLSLAKEYQGQMKIIAFIEDEEVTRRPSLYIRMSICKPGKRKTGIHLIAEVQGMGGLVKKMLKHQGLW
jgi:hypothetical protein